MDSVPVRKPGGVLLYDSQEVCDTRQCVHCGRHWLWLKGSGKRRGWCLNCNGITCGTKHCDTCIPFEKKLDMYEKGQLPELR